MKKRKTWTVAYLRTALVENGDFSALHKQKQEVEHYCKVKNLTLKRIFWDVGSGANLNSRIGWEDLVEYIASSNFAINFILSVDPSRICRNLPLLLREEGKLEKNYKLKFIYSKKIYKSVSIKNYLA